MNVTILKIHFTISFPTKWSVVKSKKKKRLKGNDDIPEKGNLKNDENEISWKCNGGN